MKKILLSIVLSAILIGACKQRTPDNPYLHEVHFDITLNLDLPRYSALKYAGNAVYVDRGGIKGVFVYNTGAGYNAFEASDPNHYPNDCSRMELSGATVQCPCEGNRYSLTDGRPLEGGPYGLKPYHVSAEGNILRIYN
ncbi:MAG: hypothetical protein GXO27_04195 [Chlorobi bacterium]|nr:hypothetical protein [Chlorobiota bacterium]